MSVNTNFTMVKKLELAAGILFGVGSALRFTFYFSKPNMPEMDLLRCASAYVQQYDGQNPREALDYAQRTLQVVAQENPEISELEKELSQVNEEIGTSQNRSIDQPVLESIGEKMEDISDKNSRSSETFWEGIWYGVASLAFLANPYTWRRKAIAEMREAVDEAVRRKEIRRIKLYEPNQSLEVKYFN
jgi:hypothetical protein